MGVNEEARSSVLIFYLSARFCVSVTTGISYSQDAESSIRRRVVSDESLEKISVHSSSVSPSDGDPSPFTYSPRPIIQSRRKHRSVCYIRPDRRHIQGQWNSALDPLPAQPDTIAHNPRNCSQP